jgi:hypothetical protein
MITSCMVPAQAVRQSAAALKLDMSIVAQHISDEEPQSSGPSHFTVPVMNPQVWLASLHSALDNPWQHIWAGSVQMMS